MKQTPLIDGIDEIVALKLAAADDFIKKVVEPLEDVGNPEKLIGKTYDQWTPQDKQALVGVYGEGNLSEFLAKKYIAEMRQHEAEVI